MIYKFLFFVKKIFSPNYGNSPTIGLNIGGSWVVNWPLAHTSEQD
jgi:hypothetical protein